MLPHFSLELDCLKWGVTGGLQINQVMQWGKFIRWETAKVQFNRSWPEGAFLKKQMSGLKLLSKLFLAGRAAQLTGRCRRVQRARGRDVFCWCYTFLDFRTEQSERSRNINIRIQRTVRVAIISGWKYRGVRVVRTHSSLSQKLGLWTLHQIITQFMPEKKSALSVGYVRRYLSFCDFKCIKLNKRRRYSFLALYLWGHIFKLKHITYCRTICWLNVNANATSALCVLSETSSRSSQSSLLWTSALLIKGNAMLICCGQISVCSVSLCMITAYQKINTMSLLLCIKMNK